MNATTATGIPSDLADEAGRQIGDIAVRTNSLSPATAPEERCGIDPLCMQPTRPGHPCYRRDLAQHSDGGDANVLYPAAFLS